MKRRRPFLSRRALTAEVLEQRVAPAVTLVADYAGLTVNDTTVGEPPDTNVAVGPTQILEAVNTALRFSDKFTGTPLLTTELDTFFAPIGGGTFFFDPVVAYDAQAGRFIVAALDQDDTGVISFLDVAVSNSSDLTAGFTEMHQIDVKENVLGTDLWADYPKLGYNADAIVFSLNMFTFPSSSAVFDHVQLVTLDQSTVTDANNATFTKYQVDRGASDFTMAAAAMHGSVPGDPMWFVEESPFVDTIHVVKMTNVLSATPTFADTDLPVAPYSIPPPAPQSGGGTIDTGDSRILNADWRSDSLVAAHTVDVGDGEATARWYEFDTSGVSPTLAQEGDIDPGSGIHTYYPSIAIDSGGNFGVTFMQSSATEFMSMYITGRAAGDSTGAMQTPVLIKAGAANYVGSRAGDYSGIAVDPSLDLGFWAANEYAITGASDNWGTWLAAFLISSGTVTVSNVAKNEGNIGTTDFVFDVTFNNTTASDVVLDYTTADGTATIADGDYVFTSGTLTFVPGLHTQQVTVPVNGDLNYEADETFTLTASNSSLGVSGFGVGTILNDDAPPTISVNDVSVTEGNAGTTTTLTFTVSLSGTSFQTIQVGYATQNGSASRDLDYVYQGGELIFAPGETSHTVTVIVNGDNAFEGDETLYLDLFSAANASFADDRGVGTILNDDPTPPLALPPASVDLIQSASLNRTFTFTDASGKLVTLKFSGPGSVSIDFTPLGEGLDITSVLFVNNNAKTKWTVSSAALTHIGILSTEPDLTGHGFGLGALKLNANVDDLRVVGPVKSIFIAGALGGFSVDDGSVGKLTVGSLSGLVSVDGDLGVLRSTGDIGATITVTGSIAKILTASPGHTADGDLTGNVTATAIQSIVLEGLLGGGVILTPAPITLVIDSDSDGI